MQIPGIVSHSGHIPLQGPICAGPLLPGNGGLAQKLPPPGSPAQQRLIVGRVGRHHHQLVLLQGIVDHGIPLGPGPHKAKPHLPALEQLVDLRGVAMAQLIAVGRVSLQKCGHQLRQHILPRHRRRPQQKGQRRLTLRIPGHRLQRLALGEDLLHHRIEPMPVLRKGHAPLAPAQQQRHPQALLQRAQMCAGSGLGQVQQLRSPGQALLLRRRRKHLQLPQSVFDHGSLPLFSPFYYIKTVILCQDVRF